MTSQPVGAVGGGPAQQIQQTEDPAMAIEQNISNAVGDVSARLGVPAEALGPAVSAIVNGALGGDGEMLAAGLAGYGEVSALAQSHQMAGSPPMPLPTPEGEVAPAGMEAPKEAGPAGGPAGGAVNQLLQLVMLLVQLLASLPPGKAQELLSQLSQLPPDQLGQALLTLGQAAQAQPQGGGPPMEGGPVMA